MKPKTYAIVGSGSIGLYYGGKLAADGHDVRFLLRAGYDEARRDGIRIESPSGDIHLAAPQVFSNPNAIGSVDQVIVSVKATANAALPDLLPPLLKSDSTILTLQNGLGSEEFLAGHFGAERIQGGLCFVCLNRITPASVRHIGHGTLSIGEFQRPPQARTRELVETFSATGIDTRLMEDLATERWRKLAWNVPFNGLAVAAGGVTTDQILADPGLLAECRALMDEILTAAKALGHPIEPEYADFHLERTYAMGPYKPSTLVDWLAGHRLEIEPIWGEPLRQAEKAGIALPHLKRLHKKLTEAGKPPDLTESATHKQ